MSPYFKVFVALSGGVDSAVAAAILQQQGHDVTGLFMRHAFQKTLDSSQSQEAVSRYEKGGRPLRVFHQRPLPLEKTSPLKKIKFFEKSPDDAVVPTLFEEKPLDFLLPEEAASAMEVARQLGIELVLFDAQPQFQRVIDDFVETYMKGETPNPCVLCNRILKFGRLIPLMIQLGGDFLATGHYVRLRRHKEWMLEQEQKQELESKLEPKQESEREPEPKLEPKQESELEPNQVSKTKLESESSQEQETLEGASRHGLPTIPLWLQNQPADSMLIERGTSSKDQSYVLYGIDRRDLTRLMFPIGAFSKTEIRQKAQSLGLTFQAEKKESQEICFVEDKAHVPFLRQYGDGRPTQGNFVSLDGDVLGRHAGYERYTIGQRKGLGMGFGERIFVQQIRPDRCEVVLGAYEKLARRTIHAVNLFWHLVVPADMPFQCDVKIRYRNASSPATVLWNRQDGSLMVTLHEPKYGVAPGQSLVCYWDNRLLGGGIIDASS